MVDVMLRVGWTEERVELLKKLHAEGHSASRIAYVLGGGISRNGVIGKVHRLKLPLRGRTPAKPRPQRMPGAQRTGASVSNRMRAGGATRRERIAPKATVAAVDSSEFEADPVEVILDTDIVGCSLLELTKTTCRWPIGDPLLSGFKFCGLEAPEDKPYCPTHSRRAVGTPV